MVLSELSQMSLPSSSWDSSESTVAAFLPLSAACPRKWRFPGPAWLQRVMALTTSACDHSFSEVPLLHIAINSCRLSSSRATRFLSFRRFSTTVARSPAQRLRSGWAGRQQSAEELAVAEIVLARHATCPWAPGRTLDSEQMVQPNPTSPSIPLPAARPVAQFNSPSHFGATRTRWSLRALARVAISASPKSSKSSGQVFGLRPRGCSGWVLVAGWDGERISMSSQSSSLSAGPEGCGWLSGEFPPLRVCQVNVTRITRKVFKILNLVFGNLSFFSGRYTVPFVRTLNPAQNWGRQTGPMSRKVSRQIDHRSPWPGRQKYFLVANGDLATGFFQPCFKVVLSFFFFAYLLEPVHRGQR